MKNVYLLFGESEGETMHNNSFYTWKKAIKYCNAYFVYKKSTRNDEIIKTLSSVEKKHLVEFNSKKHIKVFNKSEMLFVSLSNMDVIPTSIPAKLNRKPIIYLQHGILGMKKIYYTPTSYNNYLFRFVYFNKSVRDTLINENFEEYQLEHMPYQPRYSGLFDKQKKYIDNGSLLIFITWREEGNLPILKILDDLEKLNYNGQKKVILHDFIDINDLPTFNSIEIHKASEVDVQQMLCECNKFVTDFSSVIWDAAFLNKNVYLYSPDYYSYYTNRDSYIEKEEIDNCLCLSLENLEEKILLESKDTYFHNNIGAISDFDDLFIDDFIKKMLSIIHKKIVFIGYGFYGIGGTITATKAIAQRLIKEGKLVEFYSLTKNGNDRQVVPGLIMKYNFDWQNHSGITKYFSKIPPIKTLKDDQNNDLRAFNFFTELKFKKYLKSIKCSTIVSTRETYNYYIYKYANVGKKIYIFNTDYNHLRELSPKIIKACEKIKMENAVFVSKNSKELYMKNSKIKANKLLVVPNLLFVPMEKREVTKTAIQFFIDDFKITGNDAIIHFYMENKIFLSNNVEVKVELIGDSKVISTKTQTINYFNDESRAYFSSTLNIKNIDTFTSKNYDIKVSLMHNNIEICKPISDISSKRNGGPLIYSDPSTSMLFYFDNLALKFVNSNTNYNSYETTKIDIKEAYTILYKRACCAFRISVDRMQYIDDLIDFGKELKNYNTNIIIDIYGSGNAFDIFKNKIQVNGLEKILYLRGHSNNILEATKDYDIQISLSKAETFGMTYIEGILSHKKIFTFKNEGSLELFKDYSFALCDSNFELINKIINSAEYSFEEVYKSFRDKYLENNDIKIFI